MVMTMSRALLAATLRAYDEHDVAAALGRAPVSTLGDIWVAADAVALELVQAGRKSMATDYCLSVAAVRVLTEQDRPLRRARKAKVEFSGNSMLNDEEMDEMERAGAKSAANAGARFEAIMAAMPKPPPRAKKRN